MNGTQHESTTPDPAQQPHEPVGISARALAFWGGVLVVLVVVSLLLTDWLVSLLTAMAGAPPVGPAAAPSVQHRVPPEPRLDPHQPRALQALRSQQRQRLESYGWVDREAGLVRIPIERAIQIKSEQGLPARSGPARNGPGQSSPAEGTDPTGASEPAEATAPAEATEATEDTEANNASSASPGASPDGDQPTSPENDNVRP